MIPRLIVPLLAIALVAISGQRAAEAQARAQAVEKGALGLGIIIGEPTGISAKLYLSDDTAIAAAVGGAILGGGIHVHADFLWHPMLLEDRDIFVLPLYVGGGARVLDHRAGTTGDLHIGARAVAGILFDFKEIPLDAFFELAGVLDVALGNGEEGHGGFGIDLNAGLGARYYF